MVPPLGKQCPARQVQQGASVLTIGTVTLHPYRKDPKRDPDSERASASQVPQLLRYQTEDQLTIRLLQGFDPGYENASKYTFWDTALTTLKEALLMFRGSKAQLCQLLLRQISQSPYLRAPQTYIGYLTKTTSFELKQRLSLGGWLEKSSSIGDPTTPVATSTNTCNSATSCAPTPQLQTRSERRSAVEVGSGPCAGALPEILRRSSAVTRSFCALGTVT